MNGAADIGLVAPRRPVTALLESELRATHAATPAPARALRVLREEGVRSLAMKAVGELGHRRLFILERDLAQLVKSVETNMDIELGELSDAHEYRSLRPEQSAESVTARLDAGGTCYCARLGDRPVSVTWAYRGWAPVPYLWSELEADSESVVLQDSFTAPDCAGHAISPALAGLIASRARGRGLRRLIGGVLPENRPSLRARGKAGFTVIAMARCTGRGPRARRTVRGRRPIPADQAR